MSLEDGFEMTSDQRWLLIHVSGVGLLNDEHRI